MKADIVLDEGAAHAVEVNELDGRYVVRIHVPEDDAPQELSVDFDGSGGVANLLIGKTSYVVEVSEDDGRYRVHIQGHGMEARLSTLEDRFRELLHMGFGARQDSVEAGMPGAVLEVFVKAGDEVAEGERLVVLEAMKMENTIRAQRAGRIATVLVSKGDKLQTGDTILTFEAEE